MQWKHLEMQLAEQAYLLQIESLLIGTSNYWRAGKDLTIFRNF